ncbi:hypothetical protein Cali_134 [Mycobacterium phage Cali]|uniref:IraD/Gp25-like domain-containing protein n=46 Tax=Bixzunavirus TaxID=680114 RepID=Q853E5_BPMBZ|nr:baseplate protein [Mycobacterium phage Bxz1]YP_002224163.1 baseplate protein [Mycobacterium phage ScottMcG]YP_002224387.1 baseplate protein [Mycobacterium phage Spud]YP_002224607.1 baseplate protein [Mycobacterium phage Cali]YP_002224827.1 baseplate protein [Mycobacterium phage Rizal]YP_003347806.1 baseplate protein [Mycobacterium phage ET08]YP_008060938.1 baseplate protein [Mycobacterium phage Gizmo]YP_008061394.1 baseplate protein [Mycobacterium phage ArcherS7]YP_008061627.1 baseplate 
MSFSLALENGDLVQRGSQLAVVQGRAKLEQDINLWLLERYGGDRFHLNMGSILQEFIGGIASPSARAEIHAEVFRVLQNYQALQLRRFRENPQNLSASELLVSVDEITTQMTYDTVRVTVKMRNGVNQSSTISVLQST